MATLTFTRQNKSVLLNSGANVRRTALANRIPLYRGIHKIFNCHGFGLCGTCVVKVEDGMDNLTPLPRGEEKLLRQQKLDPHQYRLACQCNVHADVKVGTLA